MSVGEHVVYVKASENASNEKVIYTHESVYLSFSEERILHTMVDTLFS
jgi:hypothetical protein